MIVVVGQYIMQDTVWDFALAKLTCVFFHSFSVHAFRKKLTTPWNSTTKISRGLRLTLICALSSAPATAAVRMPSACATPTL